LRFSLSLLKYLDIDIMDFINRIKEEYKIQIKEINYDDIAPSAFVQLKCMNCGMFRRNWHCGMFNKYYRTKEILKDYNKFLLTYIKVDNTPRIDNLTRAAKEDGRRVNLYIIKRNACNTNQSIIYSKMRRFLSEIRKTFGKKILLFGSGGGCTLCKPCGFVGYHYPEIGKVIKCKKPNESFASLESHGIDVYKTLDNARIEYSVIPDYNLITVGMVCLK